MFKIDSMIKLKIGDNLLHKKLGLLIGQFSGSFNESGINPYAAVLSNELSEQSVIIYGDRIIHIVMNDGSLSDYARLLDMDGKGIFAYPSGVSAVTS